MANISSYIQIIETAARGEDVRDAIVQALSGIHGDIPDSVQEALAEAREAGSFDGVSPTVTVTTISGGHRITITDADHPSGQSFDVLDGSGMSAVLYDPDGSVAAAGGIPEYVEDALDDVQVSLNFDAVPTSGSENPVYSGGVYSALATRQAGIWRATINLTDAWSGSDPYTQTVTIPGVSANSLIDLQPDATVLARLLSDGVTAIWVDNDNGDVTVYCLGAPPSTVFSIQCTITETGTTAAGAINLTVDELLSPNSVNAVQNRVIYTALEGKEAVANKVTSISDESTNTEYPSAAAVWELFNSITDGDEVSY